MAGDHRLVAIEGAGLDPLQKPKPPFSGSALNVARPRTAPHRTITLSGKSRGQEEFMVGWE
jgi:hypothetical protein